MGHESFLVSASPPHEINLLNLNLSHLSPSLLIQTLEVLFDLPFPIVYDVYELVETQIDEVI
jgi:hypothetical protein